MHNPDLALHFITTTPSISITSTAATTTNYKLPLQQVKIEVKYLRDRRQIGTVPHLKTSKVCENEDVLAPVIRISLQSRSEWTEEYMPSVQCIPPRSGYRVRSAFSTSAFRGWRPLSTS